MIKTLPWLSGMIILTISIVPLASVLSQFQKDKLVVVPQFPPELTNPAFIPAADPESGYFDEEETVMGITLEGESRAYPLRIMAYHHVVNDLLKGRPIVLVY
jgi:hypothetical protein